MNINSNKFNRNISCKVIRNKIKICLKKIMFKYIQNKWHMINNWLKILRKKNKFQLQQKIKFKVIIFFKYIKHSIY